MAGEKDAQRARGGETKTPLRRAARPLELLSVEPHPPLAWGWHRALASGPVAGSASDTLRSGCDALRSAVLQGHPRAADSTSARRIVGTAHVVVSRALDRPLQLLL